MSRQRDPRRIHAKELWDRDRNRTLKSIAEELGVSSGQVRKWKSQDDWDETGKGNVTKSKGNVTIEKEHAEHIEAAIEEVDDSGLTNKQKAFVIEYVRTFNATQSYMNVYKSDYNSARANSIRLIANDSVKREIERVRKARLLDIGVTRNDVLSQLAKQAFSDIGDFLEFGHYEEIARDGNKKPKLDSEGNIILSHRSWVQLRDKSQVDTSLIKRVSIGRDGVVLELFDKQSALTKLLDQIDLEEQGTQENPLNSLSDEALKALLDRLVE
ncbi:terminase small subunit [Weissella sp. MSCH1]|uniref:terminase small subunit n=1 Tax=Weissella sp. MSCH1 TaxID=3383343 RepID=UPI003896BE9E